MSRARAATAALLATALAGALVACGSGDDDADGGRPTTSAGVSSPSPSDTVPSPAPSTGDPTSPSAPAADPTAVLAARFDRVLARDLEVPWGVAFLPDGSALVSERDSALVKRVTANGRVSTVGRVRGVDGGGEGGLLGIALSPTYSKDRLLFAYYTAGDENRIDRMTYDGDGLGAQRTVLDGIPAGPIHNGGRIVFGLDGYLYAGTGEAGDAEQAQDRGSLGGKILRITADGDPAPGNPFAGSPVYSYGHRNVQGLAFDPRGQLWAGEFGQNTWDELNRIRKGGNYGWPAVEGRGGGGRYVDPVRQFDTEEASPSGIAVAGNVVYLAALEGERLLRVPVPGGRAGEPGQLLQGRFGRLRSVAAAPDGSLWVTTSNRDGRGSPADGDDRILRLTLRPA